MDRCPYSVKCEFRENDGERGNVLSLRVQVVKEVRSLVAATTNGNGVNRVKHEELVSKQECAQMDSAPEFSVRTRRFLKVSVSDLGADNDAGF